MGRKMRRPQHTFNIRFKPFQIQPFMIAPVLPGETMKNLLLQSRTVTDPIWNSVIGWWLEHYFFYVKHRDLDDRDTLTAMMLDITTDATSLNKAAETRHNHLLTGIDWVDMCLERVVDEFFRDEGDTYASAAHEIDGIPIAKINNRDWTQSLTDATTLTENDSIGGTGSTDDAESVDESLRHWQFMRYHGLTEMEYEDYLEAHGVSVKKQEPHRPELLRYIRDWTYPTNTIDPSDGSPSSACSWVTTERADKDRFFKEPGFIFGVTVVRPKVYREHLDQNGVSLLKDATTWLHAMLEDQPHTSIVETAAGSAPIDNTTNAYVVDVRDLFIHGDQFMNYAKTATAANIMALPTAAGENEYVTSTDVDTLFVDPVGGNNLIEQDGVVSLAIAGRQQDYTP